MSALRQAVRNHRERSEQEGRMLSCLLERRAWREDELLRRRAELVDAATREWGFSWALAQEVFDVAHEEGLEPGFAFELVRCGVGVCGPVADLERRLGGAAPTAGEPDWRGEPPAPEARREWRLRSSFRRLRRLLDRCGTVDAALKAFVAEPDTDECRY